MANLTFVADTGGEVALVTATAKTVVQITAPANQRIQIDGWSVSFDGVSGTAEPVVVELLRQTTAGTMTGTTPVRKGVGSETIQTTSQKNATVEPTAGDVLRRYEVHPQTGAEWKFDPKEIEMAGGTRLGIRCTAPAGVNVVASIDAEE
jgi:hypothetical protein